MSDSTTLLDQIETAQSQKEATANALFDAASPASAYGRRSSACAGRVWGYYGTRYGGTAVANGTNTCGASTTTYMVVAVATGAVSFATSTTNWDDATNYARCYKVVTGASTVTSYEDHRLGPLGVFSAGSTGGGSGTVTSISASGGVQTTTGSAITGTGTIQSAVVVNAQTGTTYTIVSGDRGKRVTLSNAASIAASIAQAGSTGFADGWFAYLECIGVGAATLTPTTSTINGASTLVLTSGMAAVVFSDGTNYRAIVSDHAGVRVNAQTGTSYTYLSGDRGRLVTHTNASAIAGTLPQATGAFGAAWWAWVQNRGAGTLTITPTTSTIDGAATLTLTTGQGVMIASDGTNYFTVRGRSTAATETVVIQMACSDLGTALTTGTSKARIRAPYAFTLTDVRASVATAPTGGTLLTVDVNESGSTVLSTKLTFDASETTTTTAATPRVISDSAIADDAEITVDIDAVGSTVAGAGLIVTLIGTKP